MKLTRKDIYIIIVLLATVALIIIAYVHYNRELDVIQEKIRHGPPE